MTYRSDGSPLIESNSRGSLGIDAEHAYFYLGKFFDVHHYNNSLGNGAGLNILFDIGTTTGYIHLSLISATVSSGPCRVFLFENTTVSALGTALSVINLNRASSNVSAIAVYHTPTITSDGTDIHSDFMPLGKDQGGSNIAAGYENHMVLKPNTKYMFRVLNESGGIIKAAICIAWFESDTSFNS